MQAFESAHPQFEQPFSIDEAVHFEPGTITAEIARLQNSIAHLEATQTQLEQHIATDPDPDFVEALGDNRITLASQRERIGILRQALGRLGIVDASNPHYDLPPPPASTTSTTLTNPTTDTNPTAEQPQIHIPPAQDGQNEEGGVFL